MATADLIATIGPSSKDIDTIDAMVKNGMTMTRLNFSWGTHEEHGAFIGTIREAASRNNTTLSIIQDLSGPRIQEAGSHRFDESSTECITEKDLSDLAFGLGAGVDMVALSYVASAGDVEKLRGHMKEQGRVVPIISKIERRIAVEHILEIAKASDAIMIARGDLGSAFPLPEIPFIEEELIEKSHEVGTPAIVATGLLSSMIRNTQPSRADITDMTYALLCGADALMMSDETAVGEYPREAVLQMRAVIDYVSGRTERSSSIPLTRA